MKKYLLIVFCLVCAFSSAQTSNLKVTLKNGPIVICELKEIDPADHITLFIAGRETVIPMSNVFSVENYKIEDTESSKIVNSNQSHFLMDKLDTTKLLIKIVILKAYRFL